MDKGEYHDITVREKLNGLKRLTVGTNKTLSPLHESFLEMGLRTIKGLKYDSEANSRAKGRLIQ